MVVEHNVGDVPLVTTVTSTIFIISFEIGISTAAESISFAALSALDFGDWSTFSDCRRFVMRTLESLAVIYDIAGLDEIGRLPLPRTLNLFPYDELLVYNLLYDDGA